ncbi:MAG: peptide chain release factor 1 [Rickettsiales bacterium]|jgi:peptide chain release factor 1|nr:peptide chain release factor 1 [Rickettsiales bacterium]|tara:strand:- start:2235 stop:3299 length:1065 start_codon:yes stop_codon:yes gene_type:complete
MSILKKLDDIINKFNNLEQQLINPGSLGDKLASISKEHSSLTNIVQLATQYKKYSKELNDIEEILPSIAEQDMKEMMSLEKDDLNKKIDKLEYDLKIALLPKDEADEKNAIIEVRAGTGGEEAALFAAKLFNMYHKYCDKKGWRFEILSISETGLGGFKDASALISGNNVFANLKFESGGHRVQRVPETESQGRVHTSAATVAVLPEAEEIDIKIEEKDLRIDVFRSSGPGGQSVNTTDSAVRITHLPTGIVVSMQDEKSQIKNREKAMKVLRSRLYDNKREQAEKERADNRKDQVGSGDRSERIRTYNFPQNRVTDHRINLTTYNIEEVMIGNLDEFIQSLQAEDQAIKMSQT